MEATTITIKNMPTSDDPKLKTEVNTHIPLPVDCVAWNRQHELLAVGTYKLIETEQKRFGKLFIFSCANDGFKISEEHDVSGILDMKWEPEQGNQLALACATNVLIFSVATFFPYLTLYETYDMPESTLALYIEWMDAQRIIFSDSEGSIHIVSVHSPLKAISVTKVHPTLTWVVHYDKFNDVVYSGNDEGHFTAFLLDNKNDDSKHFKKKFMVGVTSIVTRDSLVAVGSYDEKLRIYVLVSTEPEIYLMQKLQVDLGGMVWRTKFLPPLHHDLSLKTYEENNTLEENFYFSVACGRNGIRVLQINREKWTYDIVLSCNEYKDMLAYGLDVKVSEDMKSYIFATGYFDNQMLHIWRSDLQNEFDKKT